ncbi:MAG TPA: FtsX-like permease family protein [Anaeromyxobacteraceae bacterium]|nr:FtsX-like permease family protein [Anaeromyxobacteraceae bacterium]
MTSVAWLERQRYLVDFALSSLARRKGRNLSLVAVYALVVFAVASVLFTAHALRREAALVLRDAPDLVVQRTAAGRHDLAPGAWVEELAGIRGVESARGRLWGYYLDPISRASYTVLVPGEFRAPDGEVAIGTGVARARRLEVGDLFPLRAWDGTALAPRIREILPAESEIVSADLVLVSEGDFRRLFGTARGLFTDVALSVRSEREVTAVARQATGLFPDARPIAREDLRRTYESIFDWRSGLVLLALGGSVLAFALVAWDRASGPSAEERREIGILKAIGWETSDVLLLKLWEGAVVSLAAFLTGALLAYAHVFLAGAALLEPVLAGWSTLRPHFRLVPFVSPYQVVTLLLLTAVPYTAATLVPAWRAATMDPDAVMRS